MLPCGNHLRPATTKLVLEFLYAARSVDEALFTRVNWVRVHGHIANDLHIFDTVDLFRLPSFNSRMSQEFLSCRYVDKYGRVIVGMYVLFHCLRKLELALARFEARIRFADHVNTTFATYHLAVGVACFRGLER